MTRYSIVWLSLLLSVACATSPQNEKFVKPQINFAVAKSILGRLKNQQDISSTLGVSSRKSSDQSGEESWNYGESGTGYQRLTITFGSDKIVKSVLWIPNANEQEANLNGVLSQYTQLKISAIETREVAPPHDLNTETVYSDKKTISILHNDYLKRVEAIGWFIGDNVRSPSAMLKTKSKRLVSF